MTVRKSTVFIAFVAAELLVLIAIAVHAFVVVGRDSRLAEQRAMVKRLSLTDLALFTDARYTRHPSMADLHSPFQDYPLSFEHFPSGSLMAPPPHVRTYGRH
ncbi:MULTISPECIES: hypothetical protein [Geobacter]|uniref:Uncharacterized protein n=2 Tax=Geobacter TaxID=28231 RepID=A0A0C1QPW9_9BACT|nr:MULTISPECIES: hypothetical protein [Geobacter]ANA40656.1 hypothetical protein A2G06_10590 [Geobacter anodireducens]KIE42717.1 hypothetical protein SE37_08775 [Geobacter soli]MBE2888288.1 hypothetical protein [Geobacter anodireducens]